MYTICYVVYVFNNAKGWTMLHNMSYNGFCRCCVDQRLLQLILLDMISVNMSKML